MTKSKLKKISIIAVVLVVCVIGIFKAGMIVGAAESSEPGSVNDPLITKSYLDSYMSSLGISNGNAVSDGYTKVVLSKGSTLIGHEGTEILLYSGSANSYVKGADIVNVTMGEAYSDGITLGKYCVYMCPDSEAGIRATSDVVVYVKGSYTSN